MGLLDGLIPGSPGAKEGGGGMSTITMALLGLLAYRTLNGKGRLAEMLGRDKPDEADQRRIPGSPADQQADSGGGLGGLLKGGLGGLLGGGAAGGILSGGLGDLLKQFESHGQGDKAKSWVEDGPNQSVSPNELEQALGRERIDWLMQQTGLPEDELLAGLSRELPETVNRLTPQGRIPTEQEANRLL